MLKIVKDLYRASTNNNFHIVLYCIKKNYLRHIKTSVKNGLTRLTLFDFCVKFPT